MKRIYESFSEIAEHFVDGNSITHRINGHTADECIPWQTGIKDFAAWLDNVGLSLLQNPDIYDKLWERMK